MGFDLSLLLGLLLVVLVLFGVGVMVGLALTRRARLDHRPLPRTNTVAVVGLVTALVFPLAAIPLGHIALSAIKRTNESGWGLAIASLWLGYAALFVSLSFLSIWAAIGVQLFSL